MASRVAGRQRGREADRKGGSEVSKQEEGGQRGKEAGRREGREAGDREAGGGSRWADRRAGRETRK